MASYSIQNHWHTRSNKGVLHYTTEPNYFLASLKTDWQSLTKNSNNYKTNINQQGDSVNYRQKYFQKYLVFPSSSFSKIALVAGHLHLVVSSWIFIGHFSVTTKAPKYAEKPNIRLGIHVLRLQTKKKKKKKKNHGRNSCLRKVACLSFSPQQESPPTGNRKLRTDHGLTNWGEGVPPSSPDKEGGTSIRSGWGTPPRSRLDGGNTPPPPCIDRHSQVLTLPALVLRTRAVITAIK